MTYQEDIVRLEQEREAHFIEAQNQAALRAVFLAFPALAGHQAAAGMNADEIELYCEGGVTLDKVVQALADPEKYSLASKLIFVDDDVARQKSIDKIVELSGVSGPAREHLIRQLSSHWLTLGDLQHKANEAEKRVDLRGQSRGDLRSAIQNSTDANVVGETKAAVNLSRTQGFVDNGRGYPNLPADMTREIIRKMTPTNLMRLNRMYSIRQVNLRLAGRI